MTNDTARDELAHELAKLDGEGWVFEPPIMDGVTREGHAPEVWQRRADAILAAGYSKQSADLDKAMRGAKTLGEIIEKQCRDVLDVTGLHHLINEDGDGHWDVVWMRLVEMREELASLKESTIGRERLRGDSWRDRAQEMQVSRDAAVERAEAAEDAPRTITTAEELDALPFETVIRDGDECVLERWGDIEESGWVTVMVTSFVPRDQITLPATILWEPK